MKHHNIKKDKSLSSLAYEEVYQKIAAGTLKPGDKITEVGLSRSMGISQAPVREALKRLAGDHLVVLVPRSGCFVSKLTLEEIHELYEIRKRLESMALEFAFEHLDPKAVKVMRKKFLDCKKFSPRVFVKKEVKLDMQLHDMVAEKSGCNNLQEILEKLRARIQLLRVQQANYLERAQAALNEHVAILDAILALDKKAAVKSLVRHLEHTKKNVLNHYRRQRHKF